MAKKQTRRGVSVTLATYERIKAYCELYDLSMSSFVEARIKDALDAQPENLLEERVRVAEQSAAEHGDSAAREMYEAARRLP